MSKLNVGLTGQRPSLWSLIRRSGGLGHSLIRWVVAMGSSCRFHFAITSPPVSPPPSLPSWQLPLSPAALFFSFSPSHLHAHLSTLSTHLTLRTGGGPHAVCASGQTVQLPQSDAGTKEPPAQAARVDCRLLLDGGGGLSLRSYEY